MKDSIKLQFDKDMFYGKDCIFKAGQVYDVKTENGWADRWIKRGGVEVIDVEKVEPVVEKSIGKGKNKSKTVSEESDISEL
jgi:hypothetical protein